MKYFLLQGSGGLTVTRTLSGLVVILLVNLLAFGYISLLFAQEPTPISPSSTLSPEEWEQILQPSEECELPCWLGIRPNETTLEELDQIMQTNFDFVASRSYDLENGDTGVNLGFGTSEENLAPIGLILRANNKIIHSIFIRTPIGGDIESLEYFDILNLLDIYGIPDTVRISIGGTPTIDIVGTLYFSWEEDNLAIGYTKDPCAGSDPFCMTINQVHGVFIGLQGDERTLSMDEFMYEQQHWDMKTRALSRLSSLSREDFVHQFIENEGCFTPELFDLIPQ